MRLLALVSLFISGSIFADQETIINYMEEVETPESVIIEYEDSLDEMESQELGWQDPDFIDPLDPIPDDFDLPLPIPGPIGGGSQQLVILEQIVNLGERVWKFVERNKPVINVKRAYANALPKGVRSSEDLDGFSPLTYRSFRMKGKNGFGNKVYDTTYTLIHRYGGRYDSKGYYLENCTVLPHKTEALWGYTVDVGVENIGTVNVGTKERPVGSLVMEMAFRVGTIIKTSEFRTVYEFRGDSRGVTTINNDGSDAAGRAAPVHIIE